MTREDEARGHYAWGGAHRVLPQPLRIASILATFIYLAAALSILDAADVIDLVASADLARNAVWALDGLFAIGVVMTRCPGARRSGAWLWSRCRSALSP